jgi:AcrR family transcriptional regulator
MSSESSGPAGRVPNEAVFARRRRRIVQAAVRLFAQHAYADVHMGTIAAAAGVAKPTLYRYFATKEALFIEALARALSEVRHEVRQLRAGTGAIEDRLRQVVSCILDRVGRLTPAIRAVEGQGSDLGERSRTVLRGGFEALRHEIGALLAEGVETGAFGRFDLEVAVLMVLGGVRMAAHTAAPSRSYGRDLAEAVADFLLDGLRDRSDARRPTRARPHAFGAVA